MSFVALLSAAEAESAGPVTLATLLGGAVGGLIVFVLTVAHSAVVRTLQRGRELRGLARVIRPEMERNASGLAYLQRVGERGTLGRADYQREHPIYDAWRDTRTKLAELMPMEDFAVLANFYEELELLNHIAEREERKGWDRCPTRRDNGKAACEAPNRRADKLEAEVWESVRAILSDPERLRDDLDAMIEMKRRELTVAGGPLVSGPVPPLCTCSALRGGSAGGELLSRLSPYRPAAITTTGGQPFTVRFGPVGAAVRLIARLVRRWRFSLSSADRALRDLARLSRGVPHAFRSKMHARALEKGELGHVGECTPPVGAAS